MDNILIDVIVDVSLECPQHRGKLKRLSYIWWYSINNKYPSNQLNNTKIINHKSEGKDITNTIV